MKNILSILILISMGSVAKAENIGLGFMIGSPAAISANFLLSGSHSIDAALAYNTDSDTDLYFHATYLTYKLGELKIDTKNFDWYYGFGGRFVNVDKDGKKPWNEDKTETHLGIRGSAGVSIPFQQRKFEAFGEIGAVGNIIPKTYVDFQIGLGGRFYF